MVKGVSSFYLISGIVTNETAKSQNIFFYRDGLLPSGIGFRTRCNKSGIESTIF